MVAQSSEKKATKLPVKPVALSDSEREDSAAEDEDAEAWGTSRKDYYNADINETVQDALEEEAEARRLQQKARSKMTEADFGFDQVEWLKGGDAASNLDSSRGGRMTAVIPKLEVREDMAVEEKMNILRARYPEFEPLADDFIDLQDLHKDLTTRAQQIDRKFDPEMDHSTPGSVLLIKQRSLAAYMSTLSMYFYLFTSRILDSSGNTVLMPPETLHDHSIMATLVDCRDLWLRVRDLVEPEMPPRETNGHTHSETATQETVKSVADPSEPKPAQPVVKKHKSKKSKVQKAHEANIAAAAADREARLREAETSLADLNTLTKSTSQSKGRRPKAPMQNGAVHDDDSDLGDPTALTAAEMQEKLRNKKSLKFYTSQIAQRSNRRAIAGRATGGDDDLPYREKWKERQQRLQAEADKRGQKPRLPGANLGEGDEDGDDEPVSNLQHSAATKANLKAANAQAKGDEAEDDDDYYDQILSQHREKKAQKAARASAAAAAIPDRYVDPDGLEGAKRGVTYEIGKNKGLTPRRKKEVRNPRVKKRLRFEDKKKKLGSMKPVWKGGEGRGGYGGEATGIKTGIMRGVRLS